MTYKIGLDQDLTFGGHSEKIKLVCFSTFTPELLKVENVQTHARAKFSRICAKFVLLNAF